MALVHSVLGISNPSYQRHPSGFCPIGVEVEFENAEHPWPFVRGWSYTEDGSLRNQGVEYLFSSPVADLQTVTLYVQDLMEAAREAEFETSARTGIHVHVNSQDWTWEQLRNVLIAYCLAEPMLFRYAGDSRECNPYCIPWYAAPSDATIGMKAVHAALRGDMSNARRILMGANKYSALYISPLTSFGTIEFRHLPTTLNAARVLRWITLIQDVVSFGLRTDLVAETQQKDVDELAFSMLRSIGVDIVQQFEADYANAEISGVIGEILPWYSSPSKSMPWVMVHDRPTRPGIRIANTNAIPAYSRDDLRTLAQVRATLNRRIPLEFREDGDEIFEYDPYEDEDEEDAA